MDVKEKLYTTDEIAEILRCHPQTIRRKIRQGKIQAIFGGKSFLISESSLREYMDDMSLTMEPKQSHVRQQ